MPPYLVDFAASVLSLAQQERKPDGAPRAAEASRIIEELERKRAQA